MPRAQGSSLLLPALAWVEGTLLGTVAASVAIIAVAAVGLMMLSGRVRVRPGLAVILGSFILFGASTIAAGLRAAGETTQSVVPGGVPPPPAVAAAPAASATPAADYDPHAGASVATECGDCLGCDTSDQPTVKPDDFARRAKRSKALDLSDKAGRIVAAG